MCKPDDMKFSYNAMDESIEEAINDAMKVYIRLFRAFPNVLFISPIEAGYVSPLMETHLDSTLVKGTIWLGTR